MDVSIVIPNYQGRRILPRTLDVTREVLRMTEARTEVIVVDDGSSDGSADYVRAEHAWVRLVALEPNRGFSGAANAGAEVATAPYIYFMNSDVLPHAGFLDPLVARFRGDPELFSAQSLNVNPAGRVVPPNQTSPSMRRGQIRVRGIDLDPAYQSGLLRGYGAIPTLYGAGGSVMVERQRFEELDGFAEAFRPYYYEDVDLGWRGWRRGWRSILDPESVVTHDHDAGSIKSTQRWSRVLAHRKRNRFLLMWRNLVDGGELLRKHLVHLPLHLAGRALALDVPTLRGFAAALGAREGLAEHRRRERAKTRMTNEEIFRLLKTARGKLRYSVPVQATSDTAHDGE